MSLYNVTDSSCADVRAAAVRQAGGGLALSMLFTGDSLTQKDPTLTMYWERALTALMAAAPGVWDEGFAYFGNAGATDTRRTYGTNWALSGFGQIGPGLTGSVAASGAGGTPFTYGPINGTFTNLLSRNYTTGGLFSTQVDGGAISAPISVPNGEVITTVNLGSPGVHTLKIHAVDCPTQPQHVGMRWGTAGAARRIIGAIGRFGSGTELWGDAQSYAAIDALTPDLESAYIGCNDYRFLGKTTAQTLANFSARIDAAQTSGRTFLIVVPSPSGTTGVPYPQPPADLVAGLYALADSKDCPLLDLNAVFGTWAAANSAGYMADDVHFNNAGQTVLGVAFRNAILAIVGEGSTGTWETIVAERYEGDGVWVPVVAERDDGDDVWTPIAIERAV